MASALTASYFLAVPFLQWLLPEITCLLWKKEKGKGLGRQWAEPGYL